MAKDGQVLIELKVIQKGDKLSVVAKDTERLTKAQEKQSKNNKKLKTSNEEVIKGQKGIHQSNLSSAKGFSKMNQMLGSGGSSGLVAAYATLAANVFAATAAFNAFRQAAAFQQLGEGFTFMANQAGITMDLVVDRLKEVTDGALSTQEALQGASLAVSAGFSIDQLEELAKVARGASLALGRNLNDAFDRLTRGAIKLEPEILDELGIMVRLDDATEKYAATINKTANELTQFERQTAFLNAINEQGIKKYGELADSVDVNPFDQLAASFGDLTKEFLILINTGLIPVIGFFSESKAGLIGITALFGSTIITTMVPALGQVVVKAKETAAAQLLLAKQTKASTNMQIVSAQRIITTEGKQTKTIKDMAKAVQSRSGIKIQAAKTERNLQAQLARAEASAAKMSAASESKKIKLKQARIAQIQKEIAAVKLLGAAETTQLAAGLALDQARVAAKVSMVVARNVEMVASLGAGAGFKQAFKSIGLLTKMLFGTGFAANKARKSMSLFGRVSMLTAGSVKVLGTALLTALPMIAGITVAAAALFFIFRKLNPNVDLNSRGLEMLGKTTETLTDKFAQLNKEIKGLGEDSLGEIRIRQFKQTAGIFTEIAGGINQVLSEISVADKKIVDLGNRPTLGDDFFQLPKFGGEGVETRQSRRQDVTAGQKEFDSATKIAAGLRKEGLVAAKESITKIVSDTTIASQLASKKLQKAFDVDSESALLEKIESLAGDEGLDELAKKLSGVQESTQSTATSILNLSVGISEAEQVFGKFFQKALKKTEFDDLVKSFESLTTEINTIKNDPEAGLEVLEQLFADNGVQMKKFGITMENASERIPLLAAKFKELQKQARALQDAIKKANAEASAFSLFKNVSGVAMETFLNKQQVSINKQLAFNKLKREEYKDATGPEAEALLQKLDAEDAALNAQLKTGNEIKKQAEVTRLKVEDKILNALNKQNVAKQAQLKSEQQIVNLLGGRGSTLTPKQEFEFKVAGAQAEVNAAIEVSKSKNAIIEAEKALILAQAQARLDFLGEDLEAYAAIEEAVLEVAKQQGLANTADIDAKKEALRLLKLQGIEQQDIFTAATALFAALGEEGANKLGVGIAFLNTQMTPFLQSLREMGPEGAALADAQQSLLTTAQAVGTFNERVAELQSSIQNSFDENSKMGSFFESMGLDAKSFATVIASLEIVSQLLSTMMAQLKANTAQQVAAIDRRIEAEKRLDGSSAASLAKIKQMDKKKEAIERKAFERNKKLQIAQTIVNTATAAMMAFVVAGPIFGSILAAMIVGIGKKQIDIIKNAQFDGGSQDVGISNISVGKRDNKVDVSRGASAGETAFLRGGSGVGTNANDFVPGGASGMRRGYANGGEILVGERGPEVITPTQSGYNVIPNDQINRGNSNVNFTINAVDAAGVEEVLIAQRGNIIGMIREAANEHGQEFMEDVNTGAY